jgi:hypothetical protein
VPYTATTRDLTSQYVGYDRDIDTFRPQGGITFTPGLAVRLTSQDQQIFPDMATVTLPATTIGVTQNKLMGIVAETWPGFSGSIAPPTFLSPANSTLTRGTIGVDVILRGFAPTILVDQSGAGAVTIVDGLPLVPSVAAAGQGRSQGVATATATGGLGTVAVAMLPVGAFFGSSLTAAALAQAAATFTIAGVPTLGDVYTITCTAPFTTAAPGTGQVFTWVTPPLTVAAAVSVTTAAAFVTTFLNTLAPFSTTSGYFIATSALGVITITVNALATPWQITFGSNGILQNQYNLALSGMIANNASNGLVVTAAVVGVSTFVVTTQFAGGTGYKGQIPGYVVPS